MDERHSADVHGPAQAKGVWPRRASPTWRYVLLRRFLAYADIAAALLATGSLVVIGSGNAGQLAWALFYLPAWIVIAKLLGLYEADGRSLRHLTVDEIPQIVLWALIGMSGLSLFLEVLPPGSPDASSAIIAGTIAAFCCGRATRQRPLVLASRNSPRACRDRRHCREHDVGKAKARALPGSPHDHRRRALDARGARERGGRMARGRRSSDRHACVSRRAEHREDRRQRSANAEYSSASFLQAGPRSAPPSDWGTSRSSRSSSTRPVTSRVRPCC